MLRIAFGSSFRSIYQREVARGLAHSAPTPHVAGRDLAALPAPVQMYLRRAGVVGKPRVRNFRARFKGALRRGRDAAWMAIHAEQHEFYDPASRIFLVRASLLGIPFEALHVYVGPSASMRVRIASVVEMVDARGPEMDQSETVTLFNDMCLLAPASLIDANVEWRAIDARTVGATFTNAGHSIDAVLSFDARGDLVDFVSNDRYQSDGKTHRKVPWRTPVAEYRDYGGSYVAARAEARWGEPDGEWTYARFEVQDIEYNVAGAGARAVVQPALPRTPVPMW